MTADFQMFPVHRTVLNTALTQPSESFWREWLQDYIAPTALAIDYPASPNSQVQTVWQYRTFQLSATATQSITNFSNQFDLSIPTLFLGAWGLLLSRYSGEAKVTFGVKLLDHEEDGSQLCSDPLPLHMLVMPDIPLTEWLKIVQNRWSLMRPHAQTSLAQLRAWHELPVGVPLFENVLHLSKVPVGFDPAQLATWNCPLVVAVDLSSLSLQVQYDSRRFDQATITRLGGHLHTILEEIGPDVLSVGALQLFTPAEREQLAHWNYHPVDYPQDKLIHQLFEEQSEQRPDAIALLFGEQEITYRELNERANQLAHFLQDYITPNQPVGICIERSIEMAVGLLGILKAGGGYLPLDPTYPRDRLAFMMEAAQCPVLLTQQSLLAALPQHHSQVICLDTDWQSIAQHPSGNLQQQQSAESLGFLIYTSGSTGQPKGVVMNHRPLVNLLLWQVENSSCQAAARTLQFTPISFDVSFQEIFSTWSAGGTLVLIPEELRRDPSELLQFLQHQKVHRLFLPFVALQQLADAIEREGMIPEHLQEVITAGEQLQITRQIVHWFSQAPHCTLHNHYGPSESHVVTAFTLTGPPKAWPTLPPIGQAIANTRLYVLDAQRQMVPIGVAGELYIEIPDPVRGYLNQPDLTAERFIPHPFSSTKLTRLYKTGDLVRYLDDGNLMFLGRIDHQVKIRGFRVELGEIEVALSHCPIVQESVVAVQEDEGHKQLVAYVVLNQFLEQATQQIRLFLQDHLPDYMVPSRIAILAAFPLTPSGKVDRKALQAPVGLRPELAVRYVAPGTPLEQQIATIWMQILRLDRVGLYDNFFDLGGTSILGVQMMTCLQRAIGCKLPVIRLYQYPTLDQLAKFALGELTQAAIEPATPESHQATQMRAQQQRRAQQQQRARRR